MKSNLAQSASPYLGVDLTDRHAKRPRPIDVCGLRKKGSHLHAEFWHWQWTPAVDPLELFDAFRRAGVGIGDPKGSGACKVHPGDVWRRLAQRRLAKETSGAGKEIRRRLLAECDVVGLQEKMSHDHLDAAVSALLAACVNDSTFCWIDTRRITRVVEQGADR